MIRILNQYVSPKTLLLLGWEELLITLSFLAGLWLRFFDDPEAFRAFTTMPSFAGQALVIIVVFQGCFYFNDLYNAHAVRRREEETMRLFESMGAGCMLLGLLYFAIPDLLIGRGVFVISMVLVAISVTTSRFVLQRGWSVGPAETVLVLGTGPMAAAVARQLSLRLDLNIHAAGLVSESASGCNGDDLFGYKILGPIDRLVEIATATKASRIIVAVEDRRGTLPVRSLVKLKAEGVRIEDADSLMASLTGRVWLETVRPSWFIFTDGFKRSRFTTFAKRSSDLFLSLLGFTLAAPIMGLVAVAVKLDSRGPVLYEQERVGWKGGTFQLLKFRSMRVDAEANGAQWAAMRDPRVTRVGRFIRKYRLDELPQFINVIRGDMSFVGPRPERPVFVEQLREAIPYYDERHSVRPGITGWAQIQYAYGASVEDAFRKLEYDLFYLKNMSIAFDCAIVFRTIRTVLSGTSAR
jgi:sugar transferase (PEP-CTERM system associated)